MFDYLQNFDFGFIQKGTTGYQLFVFLVFLIFLKIFLKLVVYRLFSFFTRISSGRERARAKGRTLALLFDTVGNIVIVAAAILMVLELLGVDILPLLAGAGIIGLAVGFGSQTLVKDLVSGVFIILENQYNVGDTVKIGNYTGKVKKISFRSTVIEDKKEGITYISNGSIGIVSNLSQNKIK